MHVESGAPVDYPFQSPIPPLPSLEGGAHALPSVLASPRGAYCSKESSVRALGQQFGVPSRLPRHTGVTGSLWHQAKPTSARRQHEPIFNPFGVALQGPWVTGVNRPRLFNALLPTEFPRRPLLARH